MSPSRLALVVGLVCALGALRAPAHASPAPGAVVAEVERAGRYFSEGLYSEALSTLDVLVARLDPDTLRAHPLIMVMRGRALDALGREGEALDAFDRALAWSAPGSVSHRHAERLRAALIEAAFATVQAVCRAPIERAQLVERADTRPCPAVWAPLPAGAWTVRGHGAGVEVTARVTVERGGERVVELAPPPPPDVPEPAPDVAASAPWGAGVLAGGGASTIGSSAAFRALEADWAARLALQVERRLTGWLAVAVELGLTHSQMGFLLVDAIEGELGTLRWLTVEAALLARPCASLGAVDLCGAPGLSTAWLMHAEQAQPGGAARPARHGTDTLHAGLRLGVEARLPLDGLSPSLGVHALYSPWPGAVGFTDGALPYLRAWLDAGVWF